MQILRGDLERFARDRLGIEVGVVQERRRRGLRVGAAAADRRDALVGLDHVAGTAEHEQMFGVADQQQRLEPAQRAILAPVLGQFDRRPHEIAALTR